MLGETAARRAIHSALSRPGFGCGSRRGLAQHEFAHGFEIVQRRLVAEMAERLAHLGEEQFGLVAEAEEGFGAAELLAGAGDLEDFVGSHGVRAGVAGIAAEGAVSAIVAAEVGQRAGKPCANR